MDLSKVIGFSSYAWEKMLDRRADESEVIAAIRIIFVYYF